MAGTNGKIDKRQEEAIAALLTCATVHQAAEKSHVGERTLLRWLSEDVAFNEAYRKARLAVVQQAIAQVQHASSTAVATLVSIMQNPDAKDTARVNAAKTTLEMALRGVEIDDIIARLARLEAQPGAWQEEGA